MLIMVQNNLDILYLGVPIVGKIGRKCGTPSLKVL